jgi:hypothetical protein
MQLRTVVELHVEDGGLAHVTTAQYEDVALIASHQLTDEMINASFIARWIPQRANGRCVWDRLQSQLLGLVRPLIATCQSSVCFLRSS